MHSSDDDDEAVCPISHMKLSELIHPVMLVNNRFTVFSAEHIIRWLRDHSMVDPVTNARVQPGMARNILRPWGKNQKATRAFLMKAGYISPGGGGKFEARDEALLAWAKATATMICVMESVFLCIVFVGAYVGFLICLARMMMAGRCLACAAAVAGRV